MTMRSYLLGAAAALFASCASADNPQTASGNDGRQCFRAADVNDFDARGDDRVIVRAGPSDRYELKILGVCPDIDWTQRIALRTRGSDWVCRGYDAELIVPGPGGIQRCPVQSVRQLTAAEVEAIRAEKAK